MTQVRFLRSPGAPLSSAEAAPQPVPVVEPLPEPIREPAPRKPAHERTFVVDVFTAIAAIGDSAAFFTGLWIPAYLRWGNAIPHPQFEMEPTHHPGHFVFSLAIYLAVASRMGMYRRGNMLRLRKISIGLLNTVVAWALLYVALSLTIGAGPEISRLVLLVGSICGGTGVFIWRYLLNFILHLDRISEHFRRRLLIVGWNKEVDSLSRSVARDPAHPYRLVGCLPSPNGSYRLAPPAVVPQLGTFSRLAEVIRRENIEIVLLGDLDAQTSEIMALNELCDREMVQFKIVPTYFQILLSGLHLESISEVPVLGVARLPITSMLSRCFKRGVDIVGALAGLILFSPVLLLFCLLVYRESPGPVFYRQERAGRMGRNFTIYKIRSMRIDAEQQGPRWATAGDARRLAVGAFMRRYNIDEIPQFWNVLRGEMSLVGPRPERPALIERFKEDVRHYNARHQAKPGMTGWAQIHGFRGDTDLIQRIKLDLYYLENWSPALDFYIMFMTLFRYQNAA